MMLEHIWVKAPAFLKYRDYKLHSEAKDKEFYQYPINKDFSLLPPNSNVKSYMFRVVFIKTEYGLMIVDVVVRVTSDDFTKCSRKNSQFVSPLPVVSGTLDAYQCGHRYIGMEELEPTRQLAINKRNRFFSCAFLWKQLSRRRGI
ncbi:hypothetical protein OnM2_088049 [Erysiphe neolycopersici]|uniref:Uncharacterized protein n=1 Tax=Erysiphe neolycopersici TaxID=212602 RepID=A0A420HDQ2_9PEZI|nr:hypothetical protein OnM2_088049 [Erysiphe neolycopersici]